MVEPKLDIGLGNRGEWEKTPLWLQRWFFMPGLRRRVYSLHGPKWEYRWW